MKIRMALSGSFFIFLFVMGVLWHNGRLQAQETTDSDVYLPLIQGNGSGTTQPITPLTPAEIMTAVEAIEATVNGVIPYDDPVESRDLEAELDTLADLLILQPDVFATVAYIQSLALQVILSDGTSVEIINNRPTDAVSTVSAAQVESLPSLHEPSGFGGTLPGSDLAVVANFDGGGALANEIKQKLQAKGYIVSPADASIGDMLNLYKEMSVLYLDTHGALFSSFDVVVEDGEKKLKRFESFYSVQTSTTVSRSVLELYYDQIADDEIHLAIAPGNKAKLSITSSFIEKHWTFKEGGLALMHVCFFGQGETTLYKKIQIKGTVLTIDKLSIASIFDPTRTRGALLDKGIQLVTFNYYTATNLARPSILYLFDHLLATTGSQEDPNEIPYPVGEVKRGMIAAGLDSYRMPFISTHYGERVDVVFFHNDLTANVRLAPSIEKIEPRDTDTKGILEISGDFGNKQGKVKIGETEVTVTSWTADKIIVETPTSGAGWVGEVVVLSDQEIRSNPVQLREWSGNLDIIYDPKRGTLESNTDIDIVFRGAIQNYRESITDEELTTVAPSTYLSTESVGTVSGSGTEVTADLTETWSGLTFMRLLDPVIIDTYEVTPLPEPDSWDRQTADSPTSTQNTPNIFGGKVFFVPESNRVEICLAVRSFFTATYTPPVGPEFELDFIMGLPFDSGDGNVTPETSAEFIRGSLACYNATLLQDLSIESGLHFGVVDPVEYSVRWTKLE